MTNVEDCFGWGVFIDTFLEVSGSNSASLTVYWGLFIVSVFLIMDGLFRGYRTPPKRSASGPSLSPFSTSPNQLQEVTSSANATLFDQTKISPMRGRSVKEYDEQLTALKKENFNLKLRIYFLEERMGSTFRLEDKDNIIRKNIEYQVDIETLRKELDEKQDLLCQAVKALELEDAEHKRVLASKDSQLVFMNNRIESIEHELKSVINTNAELSERNERLIEDSTQMCNEAFGLQTDSTDAKEALTMFKSKIAELELQLNEEKEHNSLLENDARELECIQLRCENLESELDDKNKKIETLSTELESNGHIVSSCNLRIRTLEDILTSKSSDIKFKDKEIIHRDRLIQEQTSEIEELRRLVEEGNVLCDKEQRQTENLKSSIMSRDNTIADLESKLEKCKSVIRNLEAKLDSIAHENKRQKDELLTIKQQRRLPESKYKLQEYSPRKPGSPRSPTNSGSPSTTTSNVNDPMDAASKEAKSIKLEEENKKAYTLIQTLVAHSKNLEKLKAEQESTIMERDQEILRLKKEKYMQYGRSQNAQHVTDNENSTEETDENKNSDESKFDMTTLEWAKQVEDLMDVIQEREEELEKYRNKCDKTTTALEQRDNHITELEKEVLDLRFELSAANKNINELKTEKLELSGKQLIRVTEEKDKKIEQLESEVRKHTFNLQGIVNNELWDKNREIEKLQNRFTEKLKLKDIEICELGKQVSSKDLQLKILKEKISELGIQINLPCSLFTSKLSLTETVSEKNGDEVIILKEQLKVSSEECKYLHKAVEELRQQLRNTPERDSDNKIIQLKEEYIIMEQELEKSERMRLETVNLCSLLTTRLEELAHFLDSLLKHKSVLGMLGSKQRSAIKQAIDQSLDLSKSLSVSIMNEDQSLAQLSSLTGLLNTTSTSVNASLFESWREDDTESRNNTSLTYNSHLSRQRGDGIHNNVVIEQAEIISILRAQIETMKKEIELRDLEICKQNADHAVSSDAQESSLKNDNELVDVIMDLQNKSTPNLKCEVLSQDKIYHSLIANKSCPTLKSLAVDNHSESEAWSEPDRCVSQARIGLDSEALKSTSSASNLNRSRSNKSGSIDGVTTGSTEEDTPVHNKTPSKRGSGSVESRHTVLLLQENLSVLENKLKEKENEILSLKTAILQMDNKSLELKLNMTEEIAKLRNEKIDIETLLKETEEKIKDVDEHNDEIFAKIKCLEEERNNALQEAEKAISQMEVLKQKTVELENVLLENQREYQNKLKEINENWSSRVQEVELEAHLKLKQLQETKNELKRYYETEWIKKTEINKEVAKIKQMSQELEAMKELLKSSDNKIVCYEKSELELKNKFIESEESNRDKIVSLKRELNESTLCASQAALERTKINNEKLKLEAEIRKLESREAMKCNELDEKEKEFTNMKNTLQKQIAVAEQQKSCLQLKVSELETANAEMHNRLVKLQTSENHWSPSSTIGIPKISELVTNFKIYGKHSLGPRIMRQKSDMSGYASEDVLTDENDGGLFNRSAPEAFHWFNLANVNINPPEVADARNVANSSPDLGIESDQGRFSSLETNVTTTRPLLQTLELTASMNNLLSNEQLDNVGHYCNITAHKVLDKENLELKKTVSKLEVGLEKTISELSKINKTKKQVEKGICKQIHKTSLVLRQARANLDSGSENENIRK